MNENERKLQRSKDKLMYEMWVLLKMWNKSSVSEKMWMFKLLFLSLKQLWRKRPCSPFSRRKHRNEVRLDDGLFRVSASDWRRINTRAGLLRLTWLKVIKWIYFAKSQPGCFCSLSQLTVVCSQSTKWHRQAINTEKTDSSW